MILVPLGLVNHHEAGVWYLVAQEGEEDDLSINFYLLERFDRIELYPRKYIYPIGFSLKEHLQYCWGMERSGNRVPVKVRFFNEAQVITKVRLALRNRPWAALKEQADGSWILIDEVDGLGYFKSWLRGFGSSAVVLEPPELRQEMIDSARRVYLKHR